MRRKPTGRKSLFAANSNRSRRDRKTRLHLQPLEDRLALTTLPAGFSETLITTNSSLSSPTAMEFSPTGELFVLEQAGDVELIRTDGTKHTALDLAVASASEQGMLGIAFDPSYDGTGPNADYVFLYYTEPAGGGDPENNRISRFTVTGAGTATPTFGSELIIRDLPPEAEDGDNNHNGGAIHFGPDGKLYAAVGDHNYDNTPQSQHVSQILSTPFGKMLRLNPDGTNPDDNPFYTGSPNDWEGSIWALGLRNPYTFAFDPDSGTMFINDVGESAWEEINEGVAGGNYGWAGSTSPLWEGFENDGTPPPWTNYQDPVMAYDGVAITGGAFYPAGSQFGAEYAGMYFFADFGSNFIRVFDPDNPGSIGNEDTSSPFASSFDAGLPVDLKVSADGSLYYLARGGGGQVYRITRDAPTSVEGRHVFYNDSTYDDDSTAINLTDDAAVATDKSAYLPGSGPATFDNITSYSRGITGVMIDLSVTHGELSLSDFSFATGANNAPQTWTAAPAPNGFSVRPDAGVGGSDRIVFTWAEGAIANTWLEVTIEGNDAAGGFNTDTGLDATEVFYFGNRIGDAGSGTTTLAITSAADEIGARNNSGVGASVTNLYDYDRSGLVNAVDQIIARNNGGFLPKIDLGGGAAAPVAGGSTVDGSAVALALAAPTGDETVAAPPPARSAPVEDAVESGMPEPSSGIPAIEDALPALALAAEASAEWGLDDDLLEALWDDSP